MFDRLPRHQILERVGRRTLLGIRFWDPALDVQIRDGLQVTLTPLESGAKSLGAYLTRSGIYAFDGIPGLHDLETRVTGPAAVSPDMQRAFVLQVEDRSGQFTGAAQIVQLPLPYPGLYLVDSEIGSPGERPRGFNLYSSVNRQPIAQYTSVRGQLMDTDSNLPAAHALLRIQTEEGSSWYGLSDGNGQFSVLLPYPFLHVTYGSSPPVNDGVRLFQRVWNLSLAVMYAPSALEAVPGTDRPSYFSILNQGQALIYQHSPGSATGEVIELTTQLNYGRNLVVATDGFSELYISPTGSPA
jgi:hypothetical protein